MRYLALQRTIITIPLMFHIPHYPLWSGQLPRWYSDLMFSCSLLTSTVASECCYPVLCVSWKWHRRGVPRFFSADPAQSLCKYESLIWEYPTWAPPLDIVLEMHLIIMSHNKSDGSNGSQCWIPSIINKCYLDQIGRVFNSIGSGRDSAI